MLKYPKNRVKPYSSYQTYGPVVAVLSFTLRPGWLMNWLPCGIPETLLHDVWCPKSQHWKPAIPNHQATDLDKILYQV